MPFGIFNIFRAQNSTFSPLDVGHFITGEDIILPPGWTPEPPVEWCRPQRNVGNGLCSLVYGIDARFSIQRTALFRYLAAIYSLLYSCVCVIFS